MADVIQPTFWTNERLQFSTFGWSHAFIFLNRQLYYAKDSLITRKNEPFEKKKKGTSRPVNPASKKISIRSPICIDGSVIR